MLTRLQHASGVSRLKLNSTLSSLGLPSGYLASIHLSGRDAGIPVHIPTPLHSWQGINAGQKTITWSMPRGNPRWVHDRAPIAIGPDAVKRLRGTMLLTDRARLISAWINCQAVHCGPSPTTSAGSSAGCYETAGFTFRQRCRFTGDTPAASPRGIAPPARNQ